MNRRAFLASLAATASLAALPRFAFADAPTNRRLVFVILRFGLDGLAWVPPHGDVDYARARGPMALPLPAAENGIVDLDGRFGLHPAARALMPAWDADELAFVHAAGLPWRQRSHFEAQDVLENGTAEPHAIGSGWLNRGIAALGEPVNAQAIGAGLPLLLRGDARVGSFDPLHGATAPEAFVAEVLEMYRDDPLLGPSLRQAVDAHAMYDANLGEEPRDSRARRGADAARLAGAAGRLLAAPDGPRVAVLDIGGFDTHHNEGGIEGGLATRLKGLADGLATLRDAMGGAWNDTVVMGASEFGRTVAGNGTGGTDHGTGGVAFLLGGAVRGGKVYGEWPGLATSALYEGRDLAITTDVRRIWKAVLGQHLGVRDSALEEQVFPDSREQPPMDGLLRYG